MSKAPRPLALVRDTPLFYNMSMPNKVLMIILDGWGIGAENASNPIYAANLETFKRIEENYPMGSLQASGISVGLPWGEIGNSEVGHLTLGAGKIVYQYYPKITMAIEDGSFFENKKLKEAFTHARENGGAVNLVGLLSEANTHAAITHVNALLKMGEKEKTPVNIHLFGDAIDGPPRTVEKLLNKLQNPDPSTMIGRYYAMDRSGNWPLVEKTWKNMTEGDGEKISDLGARLKVLYENSNEEYLPPIVLDDKKLIKDGDAVILFNYREDGIRELGQVFMEPDFDKFPKKNFSNLKVVTMTKYEDRFAEFAAFPADDVSEPLGKVISDAGKNQLRVGESYKYAHITYFFNGHAEEPFKNEYRVLIPSQKTTKTDEHPECMASAITDRLIEAVKTESFDFILANYSNPDTIAHTGNYDACVLAAKIIDKEIGRIIEAVESTDTIAIITSDHGNLEEVLNPQTGEIETGHNANPVPIYFIGKQFRDKKIGNQANLRTQTIGFLSDVAPTVLELLDIPTPADMTGSSLLSNIF